MSKKDITTFFAIAVLSAMILINTVNSVEAAHNWFQPIWASALHTYDCKNSLNNLNSSYIDECDDLQNAADVWNRIVNSDWDLTGSIGGTIAIGSANLDTGTLATTTNTVTNRDVITDSLLNFNTDYTWTDSNIATSRYDYESVAIHEFGHMLQLQHEPFNTNSPMYGSLTEDTVKRTLVQHDIDVIRDMY